MPFSSSSQRAGLMAVALGLALSGVASPARAESFDGTYLGKTVVTGQSAVNTSSPLRCPPTTDVRITISGERFTSENLSIGARSTGEVKSDGSITARGTMGPGFQSTSTGRIEGKSIKGTFSAAATGGLTCQGTFEAVRQ